MTMPAEVDNTGPSVTSSAPDGSVLVGVDSPVVPSRTPAPEVQHFTAEDVQKAREQEKSKLYNQIETLHKGQTAMNEELERLRKDREARDTVAKVLADAEAAEAKKKAEDDMDVRALLTAKEQEWAKRFEGMETERQRDRILLEREREYSALTEYRSRRVHDLADEIIPELQDLVVGDTPDEIEASLAGLVERSTKIIESATNAAQAARRDMRGTGITAPSVGPLETQSAQQQFSQAELADMPMSEYVKHRASLLNLASQHKRGLLG